MNYQIPFFNLPKSLERSKNYQPIIFPTLKTFSLNSLNYSIYLSYNCIMSFKLWITKRLKRINCVSENLELKRTELCWKTVCTGLTLRHIKICFVLGLTSEHQKSWWFHIIDLESDLTDIKCKIGPLWKAVGSLRLKKLKQSELRRYKHKITGW